MYFFRHSKQVILENKLAFRKVIENNYLEKIVTYDDREFIYKEVHLPLKTVKSVSNLSQIIRHDISKRDLLQLAEAVYRLILNRGLL